MGNETSRGSAASFESAQHHQMGFLSLSWRDFEGSPCLQAPQWSSDSSLHSPLTQKGGSPNPIHALPAHGYDFASAVDSVGCIPSTPTPDMCIACPTHTSTLKCCCCCSELDVDNSSPKQLRDPSMRLWERRTCSALPLKSTPQTPPLLLAPLPALLGTPGQPHHPSPKMQV